MPRLFVFVPLALLLAAPLGAVDRENAREALQEGVDAYRAGKLGEARKSLLDALEENPKYGVAHALLAKIYIRQGNGLSAEQQLKRAVSGGYPIANTRHLMGHAFLLQGKLREGFQEVTADDVAERYWAYAWRIRGRIHIAANEFDHARIAFDNALKLGPRSSLLWSDIARFRLNMGDVVSAGQATERALALSDQNAEALQLAGELARGQYGLIAAIPWFERAVAAEPGNTSTLVELAATLGEAGQTRAMLHTTRRVLSIDPKNPQAFYLQAVLAARAGKYDLARALLYRTNDKIEALPGVILLRTLLDIESGSDEQAIVRLSKLVDAQPGNIKARRLLGAAMARSGDHQGAVTILRPIAMRADADSYTLSLIGRAYEQLEQRQESVWFLERAAKPARGDAAPFEIPTSLSVLARANAENPNSADAAVPYITQLVANGQAARALAEADRLARLNPGAPAAYVLIGDSLTALGRHGDAVAAYKRAANIRFSEGTALRLVKALRMANQNEVALRALDLFLSQNPQNVPARLLATDYFMASGQWGKATSILERLRTRLGNRDAAVLNNLAWAWLAKGDGARAISYARAAHTIMPANAAVANTFGWAMFSTGYDKPAGIALLEKAARKLPGNPDIQLRYGQALAQSGRKAEARRALQAALTAPNFSGRDTAKTLISSL